METLTLDTIKQRARTLRLDRMGESDVERRRRNYLSAADDLQRISRGFDRAYFGHVTDYAAFVEWIIDEIERVTARPMWALHPERYHALVELGYAMVHGGEYIDISDRHAALYAEIMTDAMAAAYTIGRMNRETVEAF